MINIIAKNYIKQECIEDFKSMAKELVEATTSKDHGCKRYELLQDTKNPGTFIMNEMWETQEDIQAHMASEHFKNMIEKASQFAEKEPETIILTRLF